MFIDDSWFLLSGNKRWVWGGISYGFKSKLVIVEGSLNSEKYIDQIIFGSDITQDADKMYRIGDWILQQDNGSPIINKDCVSMPYIRTSIYSVI